MGDNDSAVMVRQGGTSLLEDDVDESPKSV